MELTPEQLQQQARLMHDNWERIRVKLSNCNDPHTLKLSTHLNIHCDNFMRILIDRGTALVESLYKETLDGDEETRVAAHYGVDAVKWIQVITFLRDSLRSQYQQPSGLHAHEDASRKLEPSPDPRSGRPTPFTVHGRGGTDIDKAYNFEKIKDYLDQIFTTENPYQCDALIDAVLDKEVTITPDEYERLFGGAYSTTTVQSYALSPVHLLLESFHTHFPVLDVDAAFKLACRAYLDASPEVIHLLERVEPYPLERLFLIARLMHSFATTNFDRSEGGKRSRSKKRGRKFIRRRKSIHRRKKSVYKKRH